MKGNGRPASELAPTGQALPVLYGVSKRRTWRKLYLAVNEATGEILAAEVTRNNKKDGQLLAPLLDKVDDEIKQVSADGAYDQKDCYSAIAKHQAKAAIPPRKDAKVWRHATVKLHHTLETRTCVPSESMVVKSGSVYVTITAAR